jgi:fumarate reductase subunit D
MEVWIFILGILFIFGLFNGEEDTINIWTFNISMWLMMILITILVIADKLIK